MNDLKKKIRKKIINLGFDVIGFTKPIVEKYGGEYLVRGGNVVADSEALVMQKIGTNELQPS